MEHRVLTNMVETDESSRVGFSKEWFDSSFECCQWSSWMD